MPAVRPGRSSRTFMFLCMAVARNAAAALTSLVTQFLPLQNDQVYDGWLLHEMQEEYSALAPSACLSWPVAAASHLQHLNDVEGSPGSVVPLQKTCVVRPGFQVLDLLLFRAREEMIADSSQL